MTDAPSSKQNIDKLLADASMCVKLAACGDADSFAKASELIERGRACLRPDETTARALSLGDEVTYTPTYGGTKLPRDGWTVEVLPKLTYVIKHPNGSVIAVDAAEIHAVEPPTPRGCPAHSPYIIPGCEPCRATENGTGDPLAQLEDDQTFGQIVEELQAKQGRPK